MEYTQVQNSGVSNVDIHVLNYSGIKDHELARCLKSLEGAPVNVFLIENDKNLWEGRKYGYSFGTAPYLSFLDADDYVEQNLPAAIEELATYLPKAMFTNMWVNLPSGKRILSNQSPDRWTLKREFNGGPVPYQMVFYARKYLYQLLERMTLRPELQQFLDWGCDAAMSREASLDEAWHYFDVPVYNWCPQSHGAHATHKDRLKNMCLFYDRLRFAELDRRKTGES